MRANGQAMLQHVIRSVVLLLDAHTGGFVEVVVVSPILILFILGLCHHGHHNTQA